AIIGALHALNVTSGQAGLALRNIPNYNQKMRILNSRAKLIESRIELLKSARQKAASAVTVTFYISAFKFQEAIARGEVTFYVGKHNDIINPRPSALDGTVYDSHHGINSVWMKVKYENYNPDIAPTVYMLNNPNHNATKGVFNTWISKVAKQQGVPKGKVDFGVRNT